MPEKQPFTRSLRFGLFLCIAFAVLHLFRLTHHGLWIDELHTYASIRKPLKEMAAERLGAGHIPTYFILMKAWRRLAGTSEWAMRLPSVSFAALAFFAFFLLARKFLADRRAFFVALALFFFHPFLLWASHDARMYALLCFASVFAAYLLLSFVESGKKGYLAGYAAAALLGLSLHMLFVLQVAAHAAFVAAHHRRFLRSYALAAVPPFAALLPVILFTISKTDEYSPGIRWKFPDLFVVVRKMGVVTSTDFAQYLPTENGLVETLCRNLSTVFFLVFIGLGVLRYRSARREESCESKGASGGAAADSAPPADKENAGAKRRETLLLLFTFYWMGVPALILAASLLFNNSKVGATRYYIPELGAFVVLAAIELADSRASRWRRLLKWGYAAFFLFALATQLSWRGPGIRESLLYVREGYEPGNGVVYCHAGALRHAFVFYDCGHFDLLPVDRNEVEKPVLLQRILDFSKGKKRIYLVLHKPKESPLPALLDDYPRLFERIEVRETGTTCVKTYRVKTQGG